MSFREYHPGFRQYARHLYEIASYYRLGPRITSGYRSVAEQERLYRAYLRGESQLPAAPPGRSLHQYGLAVDMVVRSGQGELGEYWESLGGRWGGRFRDPVHFDTGWG